MLRRFIIYIKRGEGCEVFTLIIIANIGELGGFFYFYDRELILCFLEFKLNLVTGL